MLRTSLVALFGLMLAGSANAQQCLDKQTHGRGAQGEVRRDRVCQSIIRCNAVKFFANPDKRTWSVVVVMPNGMACLLAAGESLETAITKPQQNGKPL